MNARLDISRKEATGNSSGRQQKEIIDNLWIRIDLIFDFYQMSIVWFSPSPLRIPHSTKSEATSGFPSFKSAASSDFPIVQKRSILWLPPSQGGREGDFQGGREGDSQGDF
ncbi:MAG: hypothetical protein F6K48_19085 [Okeania sp. SIO3H1]|nr:hypothetical protein [Okeania sp. SIO3H1]